MVSCAKERFEQVKAAVARLHEVQIMIMNDCDEWRPPSAPSRHAIPDPTANAAIRRIDEVRPKLEALRAEEKELIDVIGDALAIIEGVRIGLGEKYANLLEWRYIDCATWSYILDMYGIAKRSGIRYIGVAFDWIDSIGLSRIYARDFEI